MTEALQKFSDDLEDWSANGAWKSALKAKEVWLRVQESTGFVPGYHHLIPEKINCLEKLGLLKKGTRMCDLGFGLGAIIFMWWKVGYEADGFEINPILGHIAQKKLNSLVAEKRLPRKALTAKLWQGSYIPPEYCFHWRDQKAPKFSEGIQHNFVIPGYLPLSSWSAYDIFYAYLWPSQVATVFELFSLYARDDAILTGQMCGNWRRKDLTEAFGLKTRIVQASEYHYLHIIQKR